MMISCVHNNHNAYSCTVKRDIIWFTFCNSNEIFFSIFCAFLANCFPFLLAVLYSVGVPNFPVVAVLRGAVRTSGRAQYSNSTSSCWKSWILVTAFSPCMNSDLTMATSFMMVIPGSFTSPVHSAWNRRLRARGERDDDEFGVGFPKRKFDFNLLGMVELRVVPVLFKLLGRHTPLHDKEPVVLVESSLCVCEEVVGSVHGEAVASCALRRRAADRLRRAEALVPWIRSIHKICAENDVKTFVLVSQHNRQRHNQARNGRAKRVNLITLLAQSFQRIRMTGFLEAEDAPKWF